ncbi:MAG TPA: phosphatase PAP2 family protein [Miltoncostaea sp.]|nr:phosphatase PAP2 family protein [Miltoncostaea sp.]
MPDVTIALSEPPRPPAVILARTRHERLHLRDASVAHPRWETARAAALELGRGWWTSLGAAWAWIVAALRAARRTAASTGTGMREMAIALAAYGVYNLVRGLFGGSIAEGRENAAHLVSLEKALGLYIEPDAQHAFVHHSLGMPFWNTFYVASQVIVLPLTLFLVYRYRRPAYAFVRNMAILSWSAGLVVYALMPVAPPRLLASGFTDTVSQQTFFDLDSDFIRAFYNPVAAMPSLHVGMAPVVAWALIRLTPWMWTRALGWIYPVLIAVDIVVTGNHYVLDIAGGLAVVLPAAALAAWIVRVRPDVAVAGDPAPPPHPAPRPQPERERTRT